MTEQPYKHKIVSLTMNDGTQIRPGNLTVLIGPNNTGKSRILKEIVLHMTNSFNIRGREGLLFNPILVQGVEQTYPVKLGDLSESYDIDIALEEMNLWSIRTINAELDDDFLLNISSWPLEKEAAISRESKGKVAGYFGHSLVAFLKTANRLRVVSEVDTSQGYSRNSSILKLLYDSGSQKSEIISKLIKEIFNKEIRLDFTTLSKINFRISDDFGEIPADIRDARLLMQNFERLDEQGDGIKSFVGIVTALLSINRPIFLVDEPEAFLHPPQAYRIGSFIANRAEKDRQIIVSTHSTDVLRGIISQRIDVDIVRLDRTDNTNYFRALDAERLKQIINDPLLTSARVLDGLFYSAAVVVEADSDARFYQAASLRQNRNLEIHFVNADNKQTVSRIVRLYQDMGVRAAGIVDFDIINNRDDFRRSLETLSFNEAEIEELISNQQLIAKAVKDLPSRERLEDIRLKLKELLEQCEQSALDSSSISEEDQRVMDKTLANFERRFRELADMTKAWKEIKKFGIKKLSEEAYLAFDNIWKECAKHGLFINPIGELESMLIDYAIPSNSDKKIWINQALQLVPSLDPSEDKYPWIFLKEIHNYLQQKPK